MPTMKISAEALVEGEPENVFDFLVDPALLHLWRSGITEARWQNDDETGVGAKFDIDYIYGRRSSVLVHEVTVLDRPRRYEFRAISGPYPIDGVIILDGEDGKTRVTIYEDLRSDDMITAVMFFLFGWILKKPARGLLERDIKSLVSAYKTKYANSF